MKSEWVSKYRAEILLSGIIFLAGFLNLWNLWNQGFSNPYYAAAVRSMLSNPGVAFFNSFDAGGFVTVDKPPVGIWVQAASAAVFGFSSFSVTLPQALAGIGSVVLMYFIIKRPFGKPAGLIAAFALATTPVFVSTSRNGTMDTQLIFVILLAILVALKAARDHSFRLLVLSFVLVGIGFNIKMIQALVVVPAIIAIYLFGAALPVRQKVIHLAVALLVLAAVSLSWAIAVDAIPADQRPYIGSSGDNSVVGLMLGHNGEDAFAGDIHAASFLGEGDPGLLRFFNYEIYCQFSWLLLFALIGLFAWWRRPASISLAGFREGGIFSEQELTILALCLWLLPGLLYFSFTPGFLALYYLATIAPPLAGLVGISAVAMYREYRSDRVTGWVFVAAVLVTGLVQAWVVSHPFIYDPVRFGSLPVVVVAGCISCSGTLVWLRTKKMQAAERSSISVACIAVAILFIAPVAWSSVPLMNGPAQDSTDTGLAGLAGFLLSHGDNRTYLAAVPFNGHMAGTLIVDTGKPVMALGGFLGTDQIITAGKMQGMIHNGTVQYIIGPSRNLHGTLSTAGDTGGNDAILSWVSGHCTEVPASAWNENGNSLLRQYALYDCAGAV
ncbi:ArnT family glycosyltransferase [Methanoregula sp.]|uniref:ArnT family glycosyltransferase n=1 Tax=Methanoregula sp. TaxID=2052170 RepID=UPI003C75090A